MLISLTFQCYLDSGPAPAAKGIEVTAVLFDRDMQVIDVASAHNPRALGNLRVRSDGSQSHTQRGQSKL